MSNSTLPPPDDTDPVSAMAELKGVLAHAVELMSALSTRLSRVQLAMLANEHKGNTAIEIANEALERVSRVEVHLGLDAE